MQNTKLKSGKREPKQYISENPFEALIGVGKGVAKSIVRDVGKDSVYDAWDQFLGKSGVRNTESGGEMEAGEEVDFEALKIQEAKVRTEPGSQYHREIVEVGKRKTGEESREIQVKIQEILIEIKQLANSSTELKEKVEVIALEQMAEAPGKYQLNFVEMILEWIRDARLNVEDSLAWFKALRSKKAARQYGVLAKKHGASFMLSGERAVVTQTG
ncbi:MAG: hypothetical protein HYW63_03005 [Candidatus Levybacteria bacterium]|nr:hypothetical protein [Candidatus Levybacteria bacterium]